MKKRDIFRIIVSLALCIGLISVFIFFCVYTSVEANGLMRLDPNHDVETYELYKRGFLKILFLTIAFFIFALGSGYLFYENVKPYVKNIFNREIRDNRKTERKKNAKIKKMEKLQSELEDLNNK